MLEFLILLLSLFGSTVRDREALVVENLLPRHQLGVVTRPARDELTSARATRSSGSWFEPYAATGAGTGSWCNPRASTPASPGLAPRLALALTRANRSPATSRRSA
jgi:hypothetical protein